jgi:hypothetical protein
VDLPFLPHLFTTFCCYVLTMLLNQFLSLWLAICASGVVASPPSPPFSEEQPPYSPSSPTPPSPPPHFVARNTPPLPRRDQQERPTVRVLPFRPAPPSPPLPWETPRRDHEDIVWAGAANHPARRSCYHAGRVSHNSCTRGRPCLRPHGLSSAQMPAIDPPIHPSHTNGQYDYFSPPVEREEFWTDGLTVAQRTDAQQPRSAADLEWDASVDEDAYEGATAYSPTSYAYSEGYAARGRTNAAATGHDRHADRGNQRRRFESVRKRMTFGDWTQEEWDRMERREHDPPISVINSSSGSSLPFLESVSPPLQHRNPSPPTSSPPSSPEPLQLRYVTDGESGPVYALQIGPSLRHQPLQQGLVLADQLREALISGEEELMLDDHNIRYSTNHLWYNSRRTVSSPSRQTVSSPSPSPPPPQTAVASTQFCSFWSAGRRGCRRRRSTE